MGIVIADKGESLQDIIARMEQKHPRLKKSLTTKFKLTETMQREAEARERIDRRKFPDYD